MTTTPDTRMHHPDGTPTRETLIRIRVGVWDRTTAADEAINHQRAMFEAMGRGDFILSTYHHHMACEWMEVARNVSLREG
jgi:hypothetical protein